MNLYLLLARHGAIDWDTSKPEKHQRLKDGGQDVREVAARLGDYLGNQPGQEHITIGEIWHGSHLPVKATARIIRASLIANRMLVTDNQVMQRPELDPERFWRA